MDDDGQIMNEISGKLDQLIILLKIANQEALAKFKDETLNDKVNASILKILSEKTLNFTDLLNKVSKETNASTRTVKRRVSALKVLGVIRPKREGQIVYYENSGLIN